MGQFIFRRTLYAVVTLFILSLTIFSVVRLTGDPVALMAEPGAQEADLAPSDRMGPRPTLAGATRRRSFGTSSPAISASRSTTKCP